MRRPNRSSAFWALAVLGQIVFYILSFSKEMTHVHGGMNVLMQAWALLIGMDFLAVAFTVISWDAAERYADFKLARISIYVLACIFVPGILLVNILGWIK